MAAPKRGLEKPPVTVVDKKGKTITQKALISLSSLAKLGRNPVAVATGGRGVKAEELRLRNVDKAALLGIARPEDRLAPAHEWAAEPSALELAFAERYAEDARWRSAHADLQSKDEARRTALNALADFKEKLPNRVFYKTPTSTNDLSAAAYNRQSEGMFASFLREDRNIKSKTIGKYVSGLRGIKEQHIDMKISIPGVGLAYGQQLKQMRREDGPTGQRSLQLPLRSQHIRALTRPTLGYDRSSRWGKYRWALMHAGHQGLLRGGDVGVVDSAHPFEPALHITCADGSPDDPSVSWTWGLLSADGQRPAVYMWVLPTKDATGHNDAAHSKAHPVVIERLRPAGDHSLDHICPYEAISAAWTMMCEEVPLEQRASTPFFRLDSGRVVATADVLAIVREVVATLQLGDPVHYGGKSLRIGGATDILAACGWDIARAEAIIAARGRWCSEIWQLYSRISAAAQGEASTSMALASDVSVESMSGWTQPARAIVRRRR